MLTDTTIRDIAGDHGVTPAQVVIRWQLQMGVSTIPKSVNPDRIHENADVFGFSLSTDDMTAMEALDDGDRIGPDPDNRDF